MRLPRNETHKTCARCRELLPYTAFQKRGAGSKYGRRKDGSVRYFTWCKPCNSEHRKIKRAEAKEVTS
jgi:RNase P subunit RPR2